MRTHSHSQFLEDEAAEPIGEALLKPWGWFGALVILAVIATAQVGDIEDHHAEWAQSEALKSAQDTKAQAERQQHAAQAMCTSEYGPQVLAVWIDDATVECVNPRGRVLPSSPTTEVAHAGR